MTRTSPPRFLGAVFLSLLVHALLVSGTWLHIPEPEAPPPPPLEARLAAPLPPPAPPIVRNTPDPKPPKKRARAHVARTSRRAPAPPIATPPAPAAEAQGPQVPPESTAPQPEEPPAAARETPLEPADSRESAPLNALPRKGRITYTLYYGPDKFPVGKTVQTWEVEGNAYKLGSASQTSGLVELFSARRLIYLSEGRLTKEGLKPEKFFVSRTRHGRTEAARASFDWQAGTLTLGKIPGQHSVSLSAHSQDLASFMYQLALSPPPPGRMRLSVTNGSHLEPYELDVLEEEKIETPLGILRALPIRQVRHPGEESIEIWLALDYRHLPVMIRFFDKEGKPAGEQMVDEIQISEAQEQAVNGEQLTVNTPASRGDR